MASLALGPAAQLGHVRVCGQMSRVCRNAFSLLGSGVAGTKKNPHDLTALLEECGCLNNALKPEECMWNRRTFSALIATASSLANSASQQSAAPQTFPTASAKTITELASRGKSQALRHNPSLSLGDKWHLATRYPKNVTKPDVNRKQKKIMEKEFPSEFLL